MPPHLFGSFSVPPLAAASSLASGSHSMPPPFPAHPQHRDPVSVSFCLSLIVEGIHAN